MAFSVVVLTLRDAVHNYPVLESALLGKYGAPIEDKRYEQISRTSQQYLAICEHGSAVMGKEHIVSCRSERLSGRIENLGRHDSSVLLSPAVAKPETLPLLTPPTMSTFPLFSRVAV